jgi:integrase
MASVHRDPRSPRGVWYCSYRRSDGQRAFRSTEKKNRREAEIVCQAWQLAEDELANCQLTRERATEIINEMLRRIGLEPLEQITVQNWLQDWLASKEQVSDATRAGYTQAVNEFLEYLGPTGGNRRLEAITEIHIRGFVSHLRKSGVSPSTINKLVRKYLSVPFEKARKLGKIKFNPVMATDPEKADQVARDVFTPEQVARLVGAAGKDRDWAGAILFAYGCGGRLQDVANLRWSSLDLEHDIVSFRERKTGRLAIIGLHPDFVDWIAKEPRSNDDPQAYVFPSLANRSGSGRNGLSKAFGRIMERAGIENHLIRQRAAGETRSRSLHALSFHSFRHSAATAVFNQAALKEITRRVTNHSGGVVDRYIHEDLEAIRQAVNLVPRLPK